ncbi:MAG: UDP-N-acetylmuramoyl-tripeptide--D-alanyl-D-alanine ligase [Elusimicrobia bacterium]|nr:UDP-N-acetylmuramoyl-tripeptide--D-alanyl-D-alanine ligase [Elusimicrobiota bacterium]
MEKIEIKEIAKIVNGRLSGDKKCFISGVSIDSRTIKKGDVFFAIKGENYDGYNFIANAVSNGAAAVVSEISNTKCQIPSIIVKNTIKALQDFAKQYRRRFNIKVIGITGSNGKTTTKDILSLIIAKQFPVVATQGNLNNHIGVPLTLFNINKKHKYCVVEMGANHTGEIEYLCEIADPDYGIITNISSAHIGNFGSIKNVLSTKTELFKYLKDKGAAVVNNDDKLLLPAVKKLRCSKKTFGIKNNSDVMAYDISLKIDRTIFTLKINGRRLRTEIPLCGLFNVYNAIAASACAVLLGLPDDKIINGIKNFMPQKSRMEVVTLKGGIVVLNDAYNANPASMQNAIENFAKIFYNKKRILVLGDMLELGDYEIEEHRKLGEFLYKNKLADVVYAVGDLSKNTAEAAGGKWFKNIDELSEYLKKNLKKGDAVLFKASRKMALEKVIERLR